MRFTPRRNSIILLFFLFITASIISASDYYSVNMIVSYFKLDTSYDNLESKVTLSKNDKKIIIYLDLQYIMMGGRKIFINDFAKSEEGQFFLPTEAALSAMEYFSSYKYEYYVKNGEIFFTENNVKKKVEDKPVEENEIVQVKPDTKKNGDKSSFTKNKINAIIIDAGHGGKDPGAIGYNDIKEKDIVLKCALLLSKKLKEKYPDKKIVLTRDRDVFPELDDRAEIANKTYDKYGNSIFVSIHVNASRSSKPYGFETWYLVNNYSRNIVKKGSISEDKDVENVVNSLLNLEIYKESRDLANKIQTSLESQIGYVSKNRGIKEEIYLVIKKSIMPAVLVEVGFNTNKYEAIRLTKYSYLNKITDGILNGIKDFVDVFEKTQGFTR